MMLTVTILALTALQTSDAFNVRSTRSVPAKVAIRNLDANRRSRVPGHSRLQLSEESDQTLKTQSQKLARLNAMAAKLRAEASAMEVRTFFLSIQSQLCMSIATLHQPSVLTSSIFSLYRLSNKS